MFVGYIPVAIPNHMFLIRLDNNFELLKEPQKKLVPIDSPNDVFTIGKVKNHLNNPW